MAILNFGFTKINVEKSGKTSKQVNIKSNMNLTSLTESEVVKGTKQKAFKLTFDYETLYEPSMGSIKLSGDLLYLADEESAKTIADTWAKSKTLPKDIGLTVFNKILHNCNVEALVLSREINLPAPIQLPKLKQATAPTAK